MTGSRAAGPGERVVRDTPAKGAAVQAAVLVGAETGGAFDVPVDANTLPVRGAQLVVVVSSPDGLAVGEFRDRGTVPTVLAERMAGFSA